MAVSASNPFLSDTTRCDSSSRNLAFLSSSFYNNRHKVSSFYDIVSALRGGAGEEEEAEPERCDPEEKEVEKTTTTTTKRKKPKASKQAKAHVARSIASTNPNYRIQRELKEFLKDPPPGLSVQVGKNLRVWIVTVEGPGIYKGESFRLRISFPPQYPVVPPSVYFLPPHLPV